MVNDARYVSVLRELGSEQLSVDYFHLITLVHKFQNINVEIDAPFYSEIFLHTQCFVSPVRALLPNTTLLCNISFA